MAKLLSVVTSVLYIPLLLMPSEGQIVFLTGSASVAVAGDPFTFTCRSDVLRMRYVQWNIQLHNSSDTLRIHGLGEDSCSGTGGYDTLYSFTCSRNGPFTLTILDVEFQKHHRSNWSCEEILFGGRSNTVMLQVNVPLSVVKLLNSPRSPITVTEGETVTFVCETNPTWPASNVTWMVLEQTFTRGVTSQSRDEGGLTVTVSNLTFEVSRDVHYKRIYCVGRYKDLTLHSGDFLLNVNVALKGVEINSTANPVTVTEGDTLIVECTTNPTRPTSTILWFKDGDDVTEGVTTDRVEDDGGTVTVSTLSFTVTCADHLSSVRCTGVYGGQEVTSSEIDLFVHCEREKRPLPLGSADTGPGFGAGVGTGITVCLVLVAVTAGFLMYYWRRRDKHSGGKETVGRQRERQEQQGPGTETPNAENVYDGINSSTRQVSHRETYEDLQLYQNTSTSCS